MLEMMPLRVSNFIFFWVSVTPDPSRRVHCFATYPACYASIIQFICLLGSHHTSTALAINNLFFPREQLKSFFEWYNLYQATKGDFSRKMVWPDLNFSLQLHWVNTIPRCPSRDKEDSVSAAKTRFMFLLINSGLIHGKFHTGCSDLY